MLPRTLSLTLVLCLATACSSTGATRVVNADAPVVVSVGDTVGLAGRGSLQYLGVRADSRCPPAVQCIRAGEVQVDFEITEPGALPRRLTVTYPDQAVGQSGSWTVSIDALDFAKPPVATIRIRPD